jgi:hypothetical protein
MGGLMYMFIRKYTKVRSLADAARRAKSGIGQILRESHGFRSYYVLDGGEGVGVAVMIFEDRESKDDLTGNIGGPSASLGHVPAAARANDRSGLGFFLKEAPCANPPYVRRRPSLHLLPACSPQGRVAVAAAAGIWEIPFLVSSFRQACVV